MSTPFGWAAVGVQSSSIRVLLTTKLGLEVVGSGLTFTRGISSVIESQSKQVFTP